MREWIRKDFSAQSKVRKTLLGEMLQKSREVSEEDLDAVAGGIKEQPIQSLDLWIGKEPK